MGDPGVLVPLLFLADPASTSFPRSLAEPGRSVKKEQLSQPRKGTGQQLTPRGAAEAGLVTKHTSAL